MFLQKILYYLNPRNFFKKETGDLNIRAMHTINKISILMFMIAVIVLFVRWLSR